jgi:hypothetical protein
LLDYFLIKKDFGMVISKFMFQAVSIFERKWKASLSSYNIFKTKLNITATIQLNQANINQYQAGNQKLLGNIIKLLSNLSDQIESDENYWSIYFSSEERKLPK